jgi:hypothetical protein
MINHDDFLRVGDEPTDGPGRLVSEQPTRPLPQTLTHAEMNQKIEEGLATSPLYRQDVLRLDERWWKLAVGGVGWLEVTDPPMIATYDHFAARMTPELAEAQRRANIRAVAR